MINQKQVDDVKRVLSPLTKENCVKSIWVSNYEQGGNTLKTNILIDDTLHDENSVREVRNILASISTKANNIGISFMPLRKLSKFLDLLKNGDQLAISSLSGVILLYDQSGYIRTLNGLMHKGKIYGIDERSAKLFEKAKEKLARANEIVTSEITNEAYQAMIESAKSALFYVGKHPGNAETMANDLVKHFSNIIDQKHVDNLKEAYAMVERIKREPKVFDSEEIDRLVKNSKEFTKHMQDTVARFEGESDDKLVDDTLRYSIKRCSELLNIPITSESDIVNSFKKRFVDSGLLSAHHHKTLVNLYDYSRAEKREKRTLMKSKFLDRSHLHSLRIAIDEMGN